MSLCEKRAGTAFDSCVSADADSLILLSMGRADLQDNLQSGALTLAGDAEKGRRLRDTLFRSFELSPNGLTSLCSTFKYSANC
jgi:hypothetical protein